MSDSKSKSRGDASPAVADDPACGDRLQSTHVPCIFALEDQTFEMHTLNLALMLRWHRCLLATMSGSAGEEYLQRSMSVSFNSESDFFSAESMMKSKSCSRVVRDDGEYKDVAIEVFVSALSSLITATSKSRRYGVMSSGSVLYRQSLLPFPNWYTRTRSHEIVARH